MKILQLRLKNLNSLYGEWQIDFTKPEYSSNGIFALTGKTGSGKSTILDAICLALYGATPRLGKITKSSNEIMSRRTSECYAEVVFESQAGTFCCHWEQHRVRKQVDGDLAESKHEISDVHTQKLIETKKSKVPDVIEQKIGMDFERFIRSVLLAQGGFDNFLKSGIEEKSKILEQITGTQIYTKISEEVHERKKTEGESLEELKLETKNLVTLTPDEESTKQQNLASSKKQEADLLSQLSKINKARDWLMSVESLEKELGDLREEFQKTELENKLFEPDKERLVLALKAVDLEGIHATLDTIRKQQNKDKASIQDLKERLPRVEGELKQKEDNFKKISDQTVLAKKEQQQSTLLIQEVCSLDQQIVELQNLRENNTKNFDQKIIKVQNANNTKENLETDLSVLQKKQSNIEEYLQKNLADECLIGLFTGLKEQISNLDLIKQEVSKKKIEQKDLTNDLDEIINRFETLKKEQTIKQDLVDENNKSTKNLTKKLRLLLNDRLLREYRQEREALLKEQTLLQKISDLESERSNLKDGQPCPLCGSKEHPFNQGNTIKMNVTEQQIVDLGVLIEKSEDLELQIKDVESKQTNALEKLQKNEKLEIELQSNQNHKKEKLFEAKKYIEQQNQSLITLKNTILNQLLPLGIKEILKDDIVLLLNSLESRLESWKKFSQEKETIDHRIGLLQSDIKDLDTSIQTDTERLKEIKSNLEDNNKKYNTLYSKRQKIFGDKNPDNEAERLENEVANLEKLENKSKKNYEDTQKELHSFEVKILSLQNTVQTSTIELQNLESEWNKSLEFSGFSSEDLFLEARLSIVEREELEKQKMILDKRLLSINTKELDYNTRLTKERDKKVTLFSFDELEQTSEKLENSLQFLREKIASLEHILRQNKESKTIRKEKQSLLDRQKKEYDRWEKLHNLIGSADGKKYRNFAQGLTFERMVGHANHQLKKMTDRYLLIRDLKEPLQLNVVDNYQGGEIRSTKNLSGGESFIVSLNLALGLANMASRNVRVDSLFLDEGFGTLDENALEMALNTLSGLQQDGKIIGIISHVSALKEQIDTQINVESTSAGKSILSGPGVTKITRG